MTDTREAAFPIGDAPDAAAPHSSGPPFSQAETTASAPSRGGKGPENQRSSASPDPKQHQSLSGQEAQMEPGPQYQAPRYHGAGKLHGKTALITGGDSGIGRAVAVLYAREGADVALIYLPEEQRDAEETQRAVEAEGRRAVLLPGDVTEPEFCQQAVAQTVQSLGRLDVLVNNAGRQELQEGLEAITEVQWDRTFKTNIYGYFHMTKAALPYLQQGSAIINTGSVAGLEGNPRLIDYAATKGAIHAFTKALAQNLVEQGIRVNCVAPGPVWTPLNVASRSPKELEHYGQEKPMGRAAQPEEIAPAFVFFASEIDSSYVTGEILKLLGGETMAA